MKNVNITPPNQMHTLLKKLETYKMQNNPKRHSVEKTPRKNSINFHLEHENFVRRNSYQKPNLNSVNSQALQTLSDAALKVKNLLSDFLVNADPDDKQKFNIEEELNEIKKNNNNENLNLYTIIGDNSGKSSDNESNNDNMNNFIKKEIKNKKRKSDLGKRNSMLLSFNDDDFKNYNRRISYKKAKIKNLKIYSMDNTNEDTLNAINKIRSLKQNIKRNSKISLRKKIYSNDNLFIFNKRNSSNDNLINLNNRKGSAFSFGKVSGNSSNSFKRKSTDDKLLINLRKSSDNVLNFNKRFSDKNIKQNINSYNNWQLNSDGLKSSFLGKKKINKQKVHFNFIGKENNNEITKTNSDFKIQRRKKRIDTFHAPSINIQNNNNYLLKTDRIKSSRDIKKSKTLKFGDTVIDGLNLTDDNSFELSKSSTYSKDNDDIRNYIPLSKKRFKEFNNLCKNLRKSIVFNSEDKKNLLNKFGIEYEETSKKSTIKPIRPSEENKTIIEQDKKEYKEDEESNLDDDDSTHDTKIIEFQYRRLIRQNKYVYDSLSDEESLDDGEGEYYIEPNNQIKLIFDSILFFLAIFSITYPIYIFGFKFVENCPSSKNLIFFQLTFDIFCIIDLILGFFSAYYNFEEQLITNNALMIIHYIKGWFTIDFLSAIPFNSYFIFFPLKNTQKDKLRYIKDNSLYELLILIRILKLFKVFMKNEFVNKINNIIEGIDALVKWSRVYLSLFIGIASIHILSCIFIFLGTLQFPNWIYENGYELSNQKGDIYISAFYFISVTVLTVGYGDICTISLYERVFNLILLVVGIMIYSYAVSALSNYVSSVDSKTLDYQNKLAILESIRVTHEKMPQNLYDKISKFLLYRLHHETKDKNEIIDNLPSGLRNKIIIEMYRDVINNFIFFKKFDNTDFVIQVILAMKPIQASHNERLVNEGEYIEEIYFVKRGILSLEIPLPVIMREETIQKIETMKYEKTRKSFGIKNASLNFLRQSMANGMPKQPTEIEIPSEDDLKNSFHRPIQTYIKIIEIRRNEHFGDILMFLNKRSPLSVKVKSKVCELFLLKKTDAVEISMSFPKIWRKIIKKSLFNMGQIEILIKKTLKFFFIHNEGINNKGSIKENYFRRIPSMNNKLYNINANNLLNSLKNNSEENYELQSIPSDENEEMKEEESEEEEEIISEEEDNNIHNNENKKKKSTNIDTVIDEVDENISEDSKSKKTYNNISELNSDDSDYSKSKTETSKYSINSKKSNKTLIYDMRNDLIFDLSDSFYEKDKGSLISSDNKIYMYSNEDINNEEIPFEDDILIKNNESSINLFPNSLLKHSSLNLSNYNVIVDGNTKKKKITIIYLFY
jgi:CRP-like cAMP-binding protein